LSVRVIFININGLFSEDSQVDLLEEWRKNEMWNTDWESLH